MPFSTRTSPYTSMPVKRCIIEMEQFVPPCPILLHVPFDVLNQIAEAFPFVVASACVMDIAEDPLNRIGTWTVRRLLEQRNSGVVGQPLLDGFGLMNTVVIHDNVDARHVGRWVRGVQQRQEISQ